jgi:alpha,alpha-trehalase
MPDGSLLNRYWDDRDTPREESYLEDVSTAASQKSRPVHDVYRELRAGAASGWDFSSRWCGEDGGLGSIRTTSIIPVDLNSFLYKLESQIARIGEESGDSACADDFHGRAKSRKAAIDRWLWNDTEAAYIDYDFQKDSSRAMLTAAIATPLAVGVASPEQARRVAETIRAKLLAPGGLMTTLSLTGEQWDQPNGWAPLQWLAVDGLRRNGEGALATDIAQRWLSTIHSLFEREGKLVEKYELRPTGDEGSGGGGGEYPLQDGFGWTNGVVRALLRDHPKHPAGSSHGRSRANSARRSAGK